MSPTKPPRVCPGCRQTIPADQDCPRCRKPWGGRPGRRSATGSSWRKLRLSKLRTDPECELRLDDQCNLIAEEVDHIINVADGGDEWDWDNLQSACKHCHAVKTGREGARARHPGYRTRDD